MLQNTVADLMGQVESQPIFLKDVDDPEALFVMSETAGIECIENLFAGMAEGRMTRDRAPALWPPQGLR